MEGPRLEAKLQLLPPAYATTIVTQDPSQVCDVHHSSQHRWILNTLSEATDQTCVLIDIKFISTELQWELPV